MNIYELVATLGLNKDGYDEGLTSAETAASKFGTSVSKTMGTVAKVTVAAVGAAATAVGALVKSSVESYAEYEQLVGGVETLFGAQGQTWAEYAQALGVTAETSKETVQSMMDDYHNLQKAQNEVLTNAANAYKTAGLSANEYMTQVTSFAAALSTSLGGDTKAAADEADMAITDMADNANKMGTSMEAIQNAYNGFAKQNYTMLDNLKLGFGGTKEEMQRLLDTASQLSGETYDISSFADIVDAIHVVQTEMGITGTTSKEAMTTISGSLGMVKSAWANLVTGIADDNANFDQLIGNMVESVSAFGSNIIPRIETALNGVGQLVNQMLPVVLDEIPQLLDDVVPQLVDSAANLVTSVIAGIQDNADTIVNTVMNVITTLINVIFENAPTMIEAAVTLITSLASGISEQIPSLIAMAKDLIISMIDAIGEALPSLVSSGVDIIFQLVAGITEALPDLFAEAANIIYQLADGIKENLPTFIEQALVLIQDFATTLAENVPVILEAGFALLEALVEGLIEALPTMIEMIPTIITTFADIINDNMPKIIEEGIKLILMLIQGIIQAIPVLIENIPQIIQAIVAVFEAVNWMDIGKSLIEGIGNGIKAFGSLAKDAMTSINDGIITLLQQVPSKIFGIAKTFVSEGLVGGLKSMLGSLLNYIGNFLLIVLQKFSSFSLKSVGKNLIKGLWEGISDMAQWLYKQITSFGAGVVQAVKDIFGVHSPSKVFAEIGGYLAEGLGEGWSNEYPAVKKTITDGLDYASAPISSVNGTVGATSGNSETQIVNKIEVTLEGDAKRLFKVMQQQSKMNYELTGTPSFS